jgi:hypothetical protein
MCAAESANGAAFEHVPLRYQGPDPTSEYFLPNEAQTWAHLGPPSGASTIWATTSAMSANRPLVPPAAVPPDLPFEPLPPYIGVVGPELSDCSGVTDHKDGFVQKLSFTTTWLDRGGADSYGVTELDLHGIFALPAPSRDWPLLITPTFNTRLLDGPQSPDLPPRLYEAFVDFMWLPRIGSRWLGILAVAPSYYGDFEVNESEAWRLTGKGLARFDWVPDRLQLLFGVLFLNREDVRLLPAGGLIWTPCDEIRYELVFPRPKLAHRFDCGPNYEDWVYLGSEFGGNSYAFLMGPVTDIVTLRDYRIYLGLERKLDGGAGFRLEIGYAFSRTAEFVSGLPTVNADDTAHLRAGAAY